MTLRKTFEYSRNHPLTPDQHTEACISSRAKWLEWAGAYLEEHPNCCDHCWGWGTVSAVDNLAPHGSGLTWNCYTDEPCGHCELQGRCAVCGKESVDEEGERQCGCTGVEGCDWAPECHCWETIRILEGDE